MSPGCSASCSGDASTHHSLAQGSEAVVLTCCKQLLPLAAQPVSPLRYEQQNAVPLAT